MNDHLDRALARVFHDLEATGVPVPRVEPADWQTHEPSESAVLRTTDGSGAGVWVDPSLPAAEQVAMVAEQVQEIVVETLPWQHRPANWPPCPEHPANHPLAPVARGGVAMWVCPQSSRPSCEVGAVPGHRGGAMSVVPVDERDSGWEDQPRFRVYVHGGTVLDGHDWTGGATATYDVTGADVLQVVDWAQRRATNGATYAIALVVDDRQDRRGLVCLLGIDGKDEIDLRMTSMH